MPRWRGTSTERGFGYEHKQERARLLPLAYGTICPFHGTDPKCTGVMLEGQSLDLDHEIPRALGGINGPRRISHASCNRRAGQALKTALQRNTPGWHSTTW